MDGNQDLGNLAIDRAKSAALFRRPTTASDPDKAGELPIVIDGKLIGGIGISGGCRPTNRSIGRGWSCRNQIEITTGQAQART